MDEKKLTVKMLGDFSVTWEGKELFLGRTSSGRPAQLFQILMLNPAHRVTKEKIMTDLYKYGDFVNKNNSINNTIYRLRRLFSRSGIPGTDYIRIENGMCIWESEIPVEVDALEFERCIRENVECSNEQKKKQLYKAWRLYQGDLLPSNSMEEWVILESIHYKELYRECTNTLAAQLKEEENYEELFALYSRSVGIEPYEEWELGQLDALMALGEYEKAFQVYEKSIKNYVETSGQNISGEVLKRIRTISAHLKGGYQSLHDIQLQILESGYEQQKQGGGLLNVLIPTL